MPNLLCVLLCGKRLLPCQGQMAGRLGADGTFGVCSSWGGTAAPLAILPPTMPALLKIGWLLSGSILCRTHVRAIY